MKQLTALLAVLMMNVEQNTRWNKEQLLTNSMEERINENKDVA